MPDDPKTRVPQLMPGVDVRALPLGPLEGFLLSRVDGVVSVADLSSLTGLGEEAVGDIVERLVELGAVRVGDAPTVSARPPSAEAAHRAATPPGGAPRGASHVRTAPAPPDTPRALYDPAELHEDVDLDIDRRRLILDTFYRLDATNYYDLLGVARDADKKVIRSSYFDHSRTFHPDTMFRKNLGSYKQKMEAVFRKLTEAYETLGKKRTRDAYDEYLGLTVVTSTIQRDLAEGERTAKREAVRMGTPAAGIPRELVTKSIPPGPNASSDPAPPPETAAAIPPPPKLPITAPSTPRRPVTPLPSPSPTTGSLPPSTPSIAPGADERRRRVQELLARRLKHVSGSVGAETGRPSPPPPPATPQDSAKELARTLQQSAAVSGGGDAIARHVATARAAERDGKLVEAANGLRLAVALAPEREDLAKEHDRVRLLLAASLADTYEKQARYEESVSKWQAAALSWSRVAEGRPDSAEPHWRSADALLKSNGDLHRAQKLAMRAVELAPKELHARVALGRVYLVAGLKLNAKREADAAAAIDPHHDLVKTLLRDLK